MSDLEFILVNNFKCKRCGCTHYDKIFHTGFKTLGEENAIEYEEYVCRNCDYPVDIKKYQLDDTLNIATNDLLQQSKFINQNNIKEK